jgi:hypothetical protein
VSPWALEYSTNSASSWETGSFSKRSLLHTSNSYWDCEFCSSLLLDIWLIPGSNLAPEISYIDCVLLRSALETDGLISETMPNISGTGCISILRWNTKE